MSSRHSDFTYVNAHTFIAGMIHNEILECQFESKIVGKLPFKHLHIDFPFKE